MRMLRACLAGALLWAAGGCGGDGDVVSLTFDQPMNQYPLISSFHASSAIATPGNDMIHFVATSATGTLTMDLIAPLNANSMVTLGVDNSISFDITNGGWSSNSGSIAVDGVSPYRLRFVGVGMRKGAGLDSGDNRVTGSFVINGSGTFK